MKSNVNISNLITFIIVIIIIAIIVIIFFNNKNLLYNDNVSFNNVSYIPSLKSLNVKIFVDSANLDFVSEVATDDLFHGFTTNPNLLHKEKIKNYTFYAKKFLNIITDRPVSFQVISDDMNEMYKQGRKLASLGKNVFVKVPIINSKGESCTPVIKKLVDNGIKVNITGVLTIQQIKSLHNVLSPNVQNFISIWAGRISETGIDHIPAVSQMINYIHSNMPETKVIWASVRSANDIFVANKIGCDIITVTPDIIKKLPHLGKSLNHMSSHIISEFLFSSRESRLSLDDIDDIDENNNYTYNNTL